MAQAWRPTTGMVSSKFLILRHLKSPLRSEGTFPRSLNVAAEQRFGPAPGPGLPANHGYGPAFAAALRLKDLKLAQEAALASGATTAS